MQCGGVWWRVSVFKEAGEKIIHQGIIKPLVRAGHKISNAIRVGRGLSFTLSHYLRISRKRCYGGEGGGSENLENCDG